MATIKFLRFKLNGCSSYWQVNGRGPWYSEGVADHVISDILSEENNGCCRGRIEIRDGEEVVGFWVQSTLYHSIESLAPVK